MLKLVKVIFDVIWLRVECEEKGMWGYWGQELLYT